MIAEACRVNKRKINFRAAYLDDNVCPLSLLFIHHHQRLFDNIQEVLDWANETFGILYIKGFRCATEVRGKVDLSRKPKNYRQGYTDGSKLYDWCRGEGCWTLGTVKRASSSKSE